MTSKTHTPAGRSPRGGIEYGQLAVLAKPADVDLDIASQIYQWRSSQSAVEGTLGEWVRAMGIAVEDCAALLAVDPVLAALNHLAADGWTLAHVEDIEPGKLTYDRCAGDKPYVKARWWLCRPRPSASPRTPKRASAHKPGAAKPKRRG